MRLIDADAMKRAYQEVLCSHVACIDCPFFMDDKYCRFETMLSEAPTINAIPVVRCRECKHHRDKNEQEQQYLVEDILICTSPDATEDCWNAVWTDHFCSYGERKEGAE